MEASISRKFKIAVKLAKVPAWRIAYEAGIHPNVLSKIMSGAIKIKYGDERVIRVAKVLHLHAHACFDVKKKESKKENKQ